MHCNCAMKNLCIIKAGTTYRSTLQAFGDFEDWTGAALGECGLPVAVIDVAGGEPLPSPDQCCGVIVTGSHAMVTDNLPWSVAIEAWIPSLLAGGVPFLGICYGHQLLGRALSGRVGYNPRGREIGTVRVSLAGEGHGDPLFSGVGAHFHAHAIHEQSVLDLPSEAVVLAGNAHDSVHAFRVGLCAWGVQFHPEYTVPVMQEYIRAEGGSRSDDLLLQVRDTPDARLVLTNFASIARQHC